MIRRGIAGIRLRECVRCRATTLWTSRGISYSEKQKRAAPKKPKVEKTHVRARLRWDEHAPNSMVPVEAMRYLRACEAGHEKTSYHFRVQLRSSPNRGTPIQGALPLPFPPASKGIVVCVIAAGSAAEEARKAGADIVGTTAVVQDIQNGIINFNRCICHTDQTAQLKLIQRSLGPLGLMPVAKRGTVTDDVAAAVSESKSMIAFREINGIIDIQIGGVSHNADQIEKNISSITSSIEAQVLRQNQDLHIRSAFLSSTRGGAIPLKNIFKKIG